MNLWHMSDKAEIIEYKKYEKDDPKAKTPAIIHYWNSSGIEWWSEFDDNDNEIHFRCNNGFERFATYKYDAKLKKWVLDTYRDNCGNTYNSDLKAYSHFADGMLLPGTTKKLLHSCNPKISRDT